MEFKLSAIIDGHKNDVRCVAAGAKGSLLTGSRDNTAKEWELEDGQNWVHRATYGGHSNYVSCVAVMPPNDMYKDGLVYTGCHDSKIRAFVPQSPVPDHILEGHSATISSLFLSKNQTLLSCSWDTTAKVWLNKKNVFTLKDHEGAVWCGVVLSELGLMITGSADGKIKIWKAGQCKATVAAHSQAVRGLSVVSTNKVISCSNDGNIICWQIEPTTMEAKIMATLANTDFVYSISVRQPSMWAAAGENLGVKLFVDQKLHQELPVPAISTWSICFLDNGDIAAGCSDNRVYIFTADPKRQATPELMALYEAEVEKFKQPVEAMDDGESGLPEEIGGVKVADMPGPDALFNPGNRHGQTKMIKDGGNISVHEWSETDQQWNKMGDVVGQPKSKDSSGRGMDGGKVTYEGVEYDHVFHIDVDEGVVLKLPYNKGQDPYKVAQDFIHKHNLPQDYLQQIADFIVKNSGGSLPPMMGSNCDPLTGGNAYVSGSGGVRSSSFTNSGTGDPFTGGSAYTTSNGHSNGSTTPNDYFPQMEFVTFAQVPKMEALKTKLLEFNKKVPEPVQVPEEQIQKLTLFGSEAVDAALVATLMRVLRWPKPEAFPGIDIVRLALLNEDANKLLLEKHSEELMDILLQHLAKSEYPTNQMLALKSLANFFNCEKGLGLIKTLEDTILQQMSALFPVTNKQLQIAMATVLLNYSVLATSVEPSKDFQVTCLNMGLLFVQGLTEPEAKFRNLVAIGTVISSNALHKKEARDLDAKEKLEATKLLDSTQKVIGCADSIIGML